MIRDTKLLRHLLKLNPTKHVDQSIVERAVKVTSEKVSADIKINIYAKAFDFSCNAFDIKRAPHQVQTDDKKNYDDNRSFE